MRAFFTGVADISVTVSATPVPGLAEAGTQLERDRVNAEPEPARETGEVERQSLADGGSKLTPEYQSRIQAAEKLVEEAKQQLDQADQCGGNLLAPSLAQQQE